MEDKVTKMLHIRQRGDEVGAHFDVAIQLKARTAGYVDLAILRRVVRVEQLIEDASSDVGVPSVFNYPSTEDG